MAIALTTDFIAGNRSGTPGTAGSGIYGPISVSNFLQAGVQTSATDPTALTAFAGVVLWFGGFPYVWDSVNTNYKRVQLASDPVVPTAAVGTAIQPNGFVVSTDGALLINHTAAAITPTATTLSGLITDGFSALGKDAPVPDAVVGTPVAPNTLVASSDGSLLFNGTNASITPTGTTAAALAVDGFTAASGSNAVATGSVIVDKQIVVSDDGDVMVNASGAAITATGSTTATLLTDGLTIVDFVPRVTNGMVIHPGEMVRSTDGVTYINDTAAAITATGTTEAILDGNGLTSLNGSSSFVLPDAAIGTAVPDNGLIWSSDGTQFINNTGADLTPTGTTAAQLTTDGFTSLSGSVTSGPFASGATIAYPVGPVLQSGTGYTNGTVTAPADATHVYVSCSGGTVNGNFARGVFPVTGGTSTVLNSGEAVTIDGTNVIALSNSSTSGTTNLDTGGVYAVIPEITPGHPNTGPSTASGASYGLTVFLKV